MNIGANFPYAGFIVSGSLYNVGSDGRCWSRTAGSTNSAYYIYFDSAHINTAAGGNSRHYGISIRCVATT